jgi:hypothetical protein
VCSITALTTASTMRPSDRLTLTLSPKANCSLLMGLDCTPLVHRMFISDALIHSRDLRQSAGQGKRPEGCKEDFMTYRILFAGRLPGPLRFIRDSQISLGSILG